MLDPKLLKPFNKYFEVQAPLAGISINRSAEVSCTPCNLHKIYFVSTWYIEILLQEYPAYARELRQFYFGDREVNGSTLNEYTQLLSDALFNYGIYTTAIKLSERPRGLTFYFEYT